MHRFKIILVFLIVSYGGVSVSTDRGHARPDVASPFDSFTVICYQLAVGIFRQSLTVQKLFNLFI
jgi:hypothetical protein